VAHHHPSETRDRFRRRVVEVRNDLWFSWLRRRRNAAVGATVAAAWAARREPAARAGLLDALSGWRTVLTSRRPVPPELEAELRRLETVPG
jgi:hypothetical protein